MYSMLFVENTQIQTGVHFFTKEQTYVPTCAWSTYAYVQTHAENKKMYVKSWLQMNCESAFLFYVRRETWVLSHCLREKSEQVLQLLEGILTSQKRPLTVPDNTSWIKAPSFPQVQTIDTKTHARGNQWPPERTAFHSMESFTHFKFHTQLALF